MFTEYYSVMKMNLLRWFLLCQMAGDLNRSGEKILVCVSTIKEISIILQCALPAVSGSSSLWACYLAMAITFACLKDPVGPTMLVSIKDSLWLPCWGFGKVPITPVF